MTKKDAKTLSDSMSSYLQLKGLTASQEKQMDALKTTIEGIVAKYPDDWVDGEFRLEGVGCVKEVLNPPRVLFTSTGEPLNEIETNGLLAELRELGEFGKPTVNAARLRDVIKRGNTKVLAVLASHGVVCEQSKRLDIKAK